MKIGVTELIGLIGVAVAILKLIWPELKRGWFVIVYLLGWKPRVLSVIFQNERGCNI